MKIGPGPIPKAILLAFFVAPAAIFQLLPFSQFQSSRAFAHANLARSEPAPNSVLETSPDKATIWLTEPLEPEFSQISVLDVQGDRVDRADSTVDPTDPTALSVTLPSLTNGTYTVAWFNVSTVDGHRVRASFVFSVGEPIAPVTLPAETLEQPLLQSPLEPVLGWLTLLGALTITGGLVFELVAIPRLLTGVYSDDTMRRLADRISSRSKKLQWLAIGLLPAASLGPPLISLLAGTDWGQLWLWRIGCWLVLALVPGLFLASQFRQRNGGPTSYPSQRALRGLGLAVSLGVLLTLSLTSHGAATAEVRTAAVLNDYLHLLAAAIWVGGLFHLASVVPVIGETLTGLPRRRLLAQVVSRFSVLATLGTGTLIITGIYSGWAQVTIFQAVATPYGRTLVAKLLLIGPLLILGALNLMWVKPRLARDGQAGRWLRRIIFGEVFFAVLVLLAVGLLTSLEPARQVASRQGIGPTSQLTFQDSVEGAEIELAVHVPLHPDGDLFHFIQDGISGTAMPAWRDQLTEEEIWHVVNYIKAFEAAQP
jgi:copper transport protein